MKKFITLSIVASALIILAAFPASAADNFEYRVDGSMPYLAFDKLHKTKLDVEDRELSVAFAPGDFTVGKDKVLAWIKRSGNAVATYYGRLPVSRARVLIVPVDGSEAANGQAFGNAGAAVRLMVGHDISENALAQDWQLPHEMVHLTFPSVPGAKWLTEGLAVYVEPIARVQSGDLTARYIWNDFAKNLPTGLPKAGDKGLDKAEERQRVYWGGALFWLMADVEIRKRTKNHFGVQDALSGILAEGGTIEEVWPAKRALMIGDRATGEHVLSEMYEAWHAAPVSPDIDALWRDLGVKVGHDDVTFDDKAPLADIRKAITARNRSSAAANSK